MYNIRFPRPKLKQDRSDVPPNSNTSFLIYKLFITYAINCFLQNEQNNETKKKNWNTFNTSINIMISVSATASKDAIKPTPVTLFISLIKMQTCKAEEIK